MKYIRFSTCLLFFLYVLFSCQEEEDPVLSLPDEITSLQSQFSLNNFNDDAVRDQLTIRWNDPATQDLTATELPSAGVKFYEFNTNLKGYQTIDDDLAASRQVYFKLLVKEEANQAPLFTLLKFLPAKDTIPNYDASYLNLRSFSGTVYSYDLTGKPLQVEGYEKGKLVTVLDDFSQEATQAAEYRTHSATVPPQHYVPKDCPDCDSPPGGTGQLVAVRTDHYIDWYVSTGGAFYYAGSDFKGSTTEYVYVSNGAGYPTSQHVHVEGGGGGSSGGGGS